MALRTGPKICDKGWQTFCKCSGDTYFSHCGPSGLCHNTQMCHGNTQTATDQICMRMRIHVRTTVYPCIFIYKSGGRLYFAAPALRPWNVCLSLALFPVGERNIFHSRLVPIHSLLEVE